MSNVRAHSRIVMYLHEPSAYHCPFCAIVAGAEDPRTIVWRDQHAIAVIGRFHHPKNPGALLLCSLEHFENIYVLPEVVGAHLFGVSKRLAIALKRALVLRRRLYKATQ